MPDNDQDAVPVLSEEQLATEKAAKERMERERMFQSQLFFHQVVDKPVTGLLFGPTRSFSRMTADGDCI